MTEALTYIYQIYEKFLDLVFNQFEMFSGVTIGWVIIAILVFGVMITSILNIPRGIHGTSIEKINKNLKRR